MTRSSTGRDGLRVTPVCPKNWVRERMEGESSSSYTQRQHFVSGGLGATRTLLNHPLGELFDLSY